MRKMLVGAGLALCIFTTPAYAQSDAIALQARALALKVLSQLPAVQQQAQAASTAATSANTQAQAASQAAATAKSLASSLSSYSDAQAIAANASVIAPLASTAALTAEAVARATADTTEVANRTAAISSAVAPLATSASVTYEASARAAAIAGAVTAIPALLPVFDHAGTAKTPSHVVVDSCTLAVGACTVTLSGSAAFSSAASYTCIPTDQALAATLTSISNTSGSVFVIHGTLTDSVRYNCTGW